MRDKRICRQFCNGLLQNLEAGSCHLAGVVAITGYTFGEPTGAPHESSWLARRGAGGKVHRSSTLRRTDVRTGFKLAMEPIAIAKTVPKRLNV